MYRVFSNILKLIAPYLPHITEEIYQEYFKEQAHSIHKAEYPKIITLSSINTNDLLTSMQVTLDIVEQIRRYKSESQISMGAEIEVIHISCSAKERLMIQQFEDDLIGVTKAKKIERVEGDLLEIKVIS